MSSGDRREERTSYQSALQELKGRSWGDVLAGAARNSSSLCLYLSIYLSLLELDGSQPPLLSALTQAQPKTARDQAAQSSARPPMTHRSTHTYRFLIYTPTLAHSQPKIVRDQPADSVGCLARCLPCFFGPPSISPDLHADRDFVFCAALRSMDHGDGLHRAMALTVYRRLTGEDEEELLSSVWLAVCLFVQEGIGNVAIPIVVSVFVAGTATTGPWPSQSTAGSRAKMRRS